MLTDVLPAQYRKGFYAAYALIGVILGAIQVAYLNIAGQPVWLTVALAVFGFVGTAFGATAASNIVAQPERTDEQRQQYEALLASQEKAAAHLAELAASVKAGTAAGVRAAKKAAPKKPPQG